ncbi:hypothetical protein M409DRAFT_56937 [Zasmidium cellare ATCC 36951]|uniref:DUF2235 domain-containing protein n=1 Tax=Zasmidium cellare ATCC 36951 TaxID=1080233 RepID=A0A6A6CDG7_ZASCE|nr:uncharacterized protein M409DRAFT_56937 [Zasmidium cellare ATCC 36951]KAF2164250.1 hypothetical protein M409DRAFT_56937 [Zasmidium cellare ATCC 36951]
MEKKEVVVDEAPSLPPRMPSRIPTRLVICVDGARYDPNNTSETPTSVYRIFSSIQQGRCIDTQTGVAHNQLPRYFPAIASSDEVFSAQKLQATLPGQGYHRQIQDVYEACCQLTGAEDELVFFGFARGAYVVRAVAGLLHNFGLLNIAAAQSDFGRSFKKVLKESDKLYMRPQLALSKSNSVSSVSTASSGDFRTPPTIKFLGAFETIKAVSDDSAYDISFNTSIRHLRHAVALHEDRRALSPEYVYPEFHGQELRKEGKSLIQAQFIGSHGDMGGSAPKSGLGLYPAQWMIFEASACGVMFDFDHQSVSVLFPKDDRSNKSQSTSSFQAANGVVTTIQDIRRIHDSSQPAQSHYGIKLNTRQGTIRQKKTRAPFESNGFLKGYCEDAPQGTIIHPSVYMLLDEHINVALDTKEAKLQRHLEEWRERMLGSTNGLVNFGFWGDEDKSAALDGVSALRILVCGNTGVGKSTLINKTFGVDVTQSSDRSRGIHDVRQEIRFEGRPDLVVHDSGGFEAGADAEFIAIEEFLKEKSEVVDVKDRVHVIWFCIEINSARTMQMATEKLFQTVSKYAAEVPIVVVATKKDDLLDIEFSKRRKELKRLKEPFDEEDCDSYAEEQLNTRLEQIREEMLSVEGGRLDALVAVSQDDNPSISELSKVTSHTFDLDKVRILFVRAQTAKIDLKVELAEIELIRRYKALIRTSSGLGFIAGAGSIHRRAAANKVCQAIVGCFGLSVSADKALAAMKTNVWNHLGFDPHVALAGFAGGIPAWLVTGSISMPLIVPATARLFLTMSCDLILVLVRSFREVAFRGSEGQPSERDVEKAARMYRLKGYTTHVHKEVKQLVPKKNLAASYKYDKVQSTVEDMIETYKEKLMNDENMPNPAPSSRMKKLSLSLRRGNRNSDADSITSSIPDITSPVEDSSEDDDGDNAEKDFYAELHEAHKKAVELEAQGPMSGLSPTRDPVEMESAAAAV